MEYEGVLGCICGKNVFWPFFDCEISKFLLIFLLILTNGESNGDIFELI